MFPEGSLKDGKCSLNVLPERQQMFPEGSLKDRKNCLFILLIIYSYSSKRFRKTI
jgi:hypothetical protein